MSISWVLLALVATVTTAGMALISEFQKQPTIPRLFWLRLFSLIGVLPFSFFIQWPSDPAFYIYMMAISVLICGSDALYYDAAKNSGAGATTRIEPLSVLMTFVVWTLMTPVQMDHYIGHPLIGLGISACFAGAGYCALRLRHCAVSFPVMKKLAPVIVTMTFVSILGKKAMDAGGLPQDAAVAYLVVQVSFIVVFYGVSSVVAPARTGSLKPNRPLLLSALMMAICSVVHIASKNIAYTHVPNPAYVTIIGLTAPLMVVAAYRVIGKREEADIRAGLGIVVSAALLIALTKL